MIEGPLEGTVAVGQLADSNTQYAISRAIASGVVKKVMDYGALALLAIIWLTALGRRNNVVKIIIVTSIVGFAAVGCGPYQKEIVDEIGENETAFVVPLEGDTKGGQKKFMSIEYLNAPEVKVATKRITIPTRRHDIGRGWGNYEWIQTVKLIRVDRTPVTRVWTRGKDTGTSPTNQAFCVESRESVDFCAGATAIAIIPEADAALYLYSYAGKKLPDVMDQDIRGFASAVLSREFGKRTLDKVRNEKAEIFMTAFQETKEFFMVRGVTLLQFGSSEGLQYSDSKIQDAINPYVYRRKR